MMASPSLCLAGVAGQGRFRRWFQTTTWLVPGRWNFNQIWKMSRLFALAQRSYPVPGQWAVVFGGRPDAAGLIEVPRTTLCSYGRCCKAKKRLRP